MKLTPLHDRVISQGRRHRIPRGARRRPVRDHRL